MRLTRMIENLELKVKSSTCSNLFEPYLFAALQANVAVSSYVRLMQMPSTTLEQYGSNRALVLLAAYAAAVNKSTSVSLFTPVALRASEILSHVTNYDRLIDFALCSDPHVWKETESALYRPTHLPARIHQSPALFHNKSPKHANCHEVR
ncbi:hypothetical protein N7G274_000481 [Stereocaulon virgatum]|uniref:Uncharacterized protein n=1 Tax=Stereocaulon virgatum TaxID=373712 RepID=A0ABR4AS89_9LECA